LCWIGTEVCELPLFDGLGDVEILFLEFKGLIVEPQILLALDVALRDTPAIWWVAHKVSIQNWIQCKRLMQIRFCETNGYVSGYYSGMDDPIEHILKCEYVWNELRREAWPHMFIHTLDIIPKNWYIQLEL